MSTKKQIGIGVISLGWMGRLHARSYRSVSERFPEPGATAHPAAEYYTYTVERPGQEERTDRTSLNSVKVVAVPGENCIEVVAVASGGRAADPVRECVQVP